MYIFDMDDLVPRIVTGDEAAFAELAKREYQSLVRAAYHVVRSYAVAQEVVQDSLLELWRIRATLDPSKSIAGLALTIVRRKAINEWHRTSAESRREANLTTTESHYLGERITASGEDETIERVAFEEIINELPGRTALALRLRYLSQLSFPEIGKALGVSDKAAQQIIIRGINHLRERLGPR